MRPGWKTLLILILTAAAMVTTPAVQGQTHIAGSVGADLGVYSFTNSLFSQPLDYSADRRLSNQWVDLNVIGPLVNGYFARYNLRGRVRGTQIRSEADGVKTTEYLNPKLTNYYGSLSLFPERPFPLMVYTGRTEDNSVRYEAANRSQVDLVDPGLAVVRRYETITKGTGGVWRYAATQDLDFALEAKQTQNEVSRQYDFDENRNIWVDFTTISPGVSPFYNIEVANTIPDHDVLLFVDFAFVDTVKANDVLNLVIEEGVRDIDFVPIGLNSYSQRLDVNSDQLWKIFYSDPPGSKDQDQKNDIITGKMRYGRDGKFTNDGFFELNAGEEDVQKMITDLKVFNNLANYNFSPTASINSLTNYSSNQTDVGVISSQLSKVFQQQTTGKWTKPGQLNTALSHVYSKMNSKTGMDQVTSTNNILNGLVNVPTHWHKHQVDFVLGANLLKDNKGLVNNKYNAEMRNLAEFRTGGLRLKPRHQFKLAKGKQENPSSSNSEIESRLSLEGEHPRLGTLGSLRFKFEYDWKKRGNESNDLTNNKYVSDLGLTRRFGKKYMAKVAFGYELETFGNVSKDPEFSDQPEANAREAEKRRVFRFDVQAAPSPRVDFSLGGIWIRSNDSIISKYSGSISLKVPLVEIPLRTNFLKEKRELEGVRPQEIFQVETKIGYNWRKIRLTLSHKYTDETLVTENYTYNEFVVQVVRDFDIM